MKPQPNHIGILGGGQLGRMLIQSAVDWNLDISILDADAQAPCHAIAHQFHQGSITDYQSVLDFGRKCDLISIEIENVNTDALKQLESEGIPVYPQPHIIELIQDKRLQKSFYQKKGLPTADFILLDQAEWQEDHEGMLPGFFKLGRAGYDGRGVHRIVQPSDFEQAPAGAGLLERQVDFYKEISVIVARNKRGQVASFPTVELAFHPQQNLVEFLFAPAEISQEQDQEAQQLAQRVIQELDMIGLLAVEMFIDQQGAILVNEIAPRPHNSGHHTIEANVTSQYQQHLRAILDLPLGSTDLITPAAMVNLLGEPGCEGPAKYEGLEQVLDIPGAYVHLYGKKITKPFRKMGHVTITDTNLQDLRERVSYIKSILKIVS